MHEACRPEDPGPVDRSAGDSVIFGEHEDWPPQGGQGLFAVGVQYPPISSAEIFGGLICGGGGAIGWFTDGRGAWGRVREEPSPD